METTLTLRNRLGFNEMTLWKQFCSRRLHLIHTLSLSLRKASEQEEQVRVLAAELCAEYGFDPSAQADFEKLLIAGIQSVRRNQKRSARNPSGNTVPVVEQYAVRTDISPVQNATVLTQQQPTHQATQQQPIHHQHQHQQQQQQQQKPQTSQQPMPPQPGTVAQSPQYPHQQQYYYQPHIQQLPHVQHNSSDPQLTPQLNHIQDLHTNKRGQYPSSTPSSASISSSSPSLSHSSQASTYGMAPPQIASSDDSHMHQSLIARLDVLRSMVGAGSAMWIESHAPQVARLSAQGVLSTAVATAAVHAKLSYEETTIMRQCATEGPLLEAVKHALDPNMSTARLMERIGALGASLVHGPHLLSALQALCVCLAQATNGVPEEMCKLLSPATFEKFYASQATPHTAIPQTETSRGEGEGGRGVEPIPSPAPSGQNSVLKPGDVYRNPPGLSGSVSEHIPAHLSIPRTPTSATLPSESQPRYTPYHNPLPSYETRPNPLIGIPPRPRSQQQQQSQEEENRSKPQSNRDNDLASYSMTKLPMPRPANFSEPLKAPLQRAQSPSGCPPASGIQFNVPDRFVSLEYNGRILEMTYSPMKATPPTLSEIIDNGRSMFSIPTSTVARVKDLQTKKIIESDSELIDAFTQQQVKLELFLPPPMLVGLPPTPKPAKFTPLAPIFRTST